LAEAPRRRIAKMEMVHGTLAKVTFVPASESNGCGHTVFKRVNNWTWFRLQGYATCQRCAADRAGPDG
jgi:hypothetical protein